MPCTSKEFCFKRGILLRFLLNLTIYFPRDSLWLVSPFCGPMKATDIFHWRATDRNATPTCILDSTTFCKACYPGQRQHVSITLKVWQFIITLSSLLHSSPVLRPVDDFERKNPRPPHNFTIFWAPTPPVSILRMVYSTGKQETVSKDHNVTTAVITWTNKNLPKNAEHTGLLTKQICFLL